MVILTGAVPCLGLRHPSKVRLQTEAIFPNSSLIQALDNPSILMQISSSSLFYLRFRRFLNSVLFAHAIVGIQSFPRSTQFCQSTRR